MSSLSRKTGEFSSDIRYLPSTQTINIPPVTYFIFIYSASLPSESFLAYRLPADQLGVGLVLIDDFQDARLVVVRVKDLVEPRVALLVVEEVHQLGAVDEFFLAAVYRTKQFIDIITGTNGLVDFIKLKKCSVVSSSG